MEYGCFMDIRPSTTCSEEAYGRLLPLLCDGPEVISGQCDNTQEEVYDIKEEQGQTETCKDKMEPMSLSHYLIPQWQVTCRSWYMSH